MINVNTMNCIKKTDDVKTEIKENKNITLNLTKLTVFATWRYNSDNQDCNICHKDLMIAIQSPGTNKMNGDVTIGECNHAYHTICINNWLSNQTIRCPTCMAWWRTASNVGSSVYVYKSTV